MLPLIGLEKMGRSLTIDTWEEANFNLNSDFADLVIMDYYDRYSLTSL